MSQDLFAAFMGGDDFSHQPSGSAALFGEQIVHTERPPEQSQTADEDDWGEFEAADVLSTTAHVAATEHVQLTPKHHYSLEDLGPSHGVLSKAGLRSSYVPAIKPAVQPSDKVFADHRSAAIATDVLFDASETDEDSGNDDFADFEDFQSTLDTEIPKLAEIDLLGLDDEVVVQPGRPQPPVVTEQKILPVRTGGTKKGPVDNLSTATDFGRTSQSDTTEEVWDDFSAWDNNAPQTSNSAHAPMLLEFKPLKANTHSKISDDVVPPTNVPPPAVILSIFPSIFDRVDTELLKPAAAQPHAARQAIYASPQAAAYLHDYTHILTVLARILAGRKLRWKRDTLLAQSMRIGSAATAGRASGMKVASVDRAEAQKEEGEVAEVLAAWAAQAGRVRTAVHEARKTLRGVLPVPEIKAVMPVKTAKQIEGGVPGVRPCALCGLRRDERIAKVDVDVMDSFGEWWIETTSMHTGLFCKS